MKRVFTTKKKLSGAMFYRKWDDWAIGDIFIGEYTGTKKDTQYDTEHFVFKVVETQFKDKKANFEGGKTVVLNRCGMLAKALDGVEFGQIIQLEYNGIGTMKKGKFKGKEAHSMEIQLVELEESSDDSVDDL
ncbi:hypothetical protein EKK58_08375 [Candidatus Dependentiae bacterium]|nr:MAG: hypothetical protein EKK58_08375 [Candidatus Dependentiae bacterium]